MKRERRGFTLVELVVVIVIIGILAALGTVSYRKSLERSKQAEGVTILRVIYDAQMRKYAEEAQFENAVLQSYGQVNTSLGIDLKPFKYFMDTIQIDLIDTGAPYADQDVAIVRRDIDGDGNPDYGIKIDFEGDYLYENPAGISNPGGLPQ